MVGGTKQPKVTYQTVATNVKCRIEPVSGDLTNTILGRIHDATHRMFINANVQIEPNYLIIDADDHEYLVQEVQDAAGAAHHNEVILRTM